MKEVVMQEPSGEEARDATIVQRALRAFGSESAKCPESVRLRIESNLRDELARRKNAQ